MLAVWAAAALAVALIGGRYLQSTAAGAGESARSGGEQARPVFSTASSTAGRPRTDRELVVHVAGAVRRPGLVHLREGARAGDAIRAAGGARRGADLAGVNLAMRIVDGQQVVVPGAGVVAPGSGAGGPVSLNAATVEQLDELDGIGPGLAEKIVEYRTQNGGFRSVDELADVPGIGEKRLEALQGKLQP